MENQQPHFTICPQCKGQGKKSRKLRKQARIRHQLACIQFETSNFKGTPPVRPKGHQYSCPACAGTGLIQAANPPLPDNANMPHIAIIGAGIGGVALAVACLHRSIPFTLYERDSSFNVRSQGYGLTLQQATRAIQGLGISSLKEKVISTRHLVHTPDGKVIGEWGMRKWMPQNADAAPKRTNMHIARQSLRFALLSQLGGPNVVRWSHQLIDFKENENQSINLTFQVNGETKTAKADLIVGADGIRSAVRRLLIGDNSTPLRYLGCIVILGICPLETLHTQDIHSSLLDSATVFQTANGNERIYIMPYSQNSVMWQLSFPMPEEDAKTLSARGPEALKQQAINRIQWHAPIPQILSATDVDLISGYPVYDRELLNAEMMDNCGKATLIGDAAHPMSPFKGQGANQALLDALSLARIISKACRPLSQWREAGIRKSVLAEFEKEMLERSASKVKGSAAAAQFLHSEVVLHKADEPRGRCLNRNET